MKPSPKSIINALRAAVTVILLAVAPAHAEKLEAGPNGGRLVGAAPDQAELLISPEGIATITFLDAEKKPTAPGDRTVALFAQLDSGRKEIELERKGDAFVTKEALPQPEGYLLVVQTRSAPGAKPTNTRARYEMHVCGGCKLREYACTCEEH
jgi:hypothetical protein